MLSNAGKYALGLTALGIVAFAVASDDRAAAVIFIGLAIAAGIIALGLSRTVGADLAPFAAKDAPVVSTPVDPAEAPRGSIGPLVAAIGATVSLSGGALGPRFVLFGGLAFLVGAGIWTFDSFRAPGVLDEATAANVDNRLLGPVALPVGAFFLAITIAFCFSRVLLAVPDKASWIIAFLVAASLLGVLTMIAEKVPATKVIATMAGVGLLSVLIAGGAGASIGERKFEKKGYTPPAAMITAHNISYDRNVIALPGNTDVTLSFTNLDVGTFHNVSFYTEGEPGTPIYSGKPLDHGHLTYHFHTPAPGTYRYICDFHPTQMTGEFRVGPAPTTKESNK